MILILIVNLIHVASNIHCETRGICVFVTLAAVVFSWQFHRD